MNMPNEQIQTTEAQLSAQNVAATAADSFCTEFAAWLASYDPSLSSGRVAIETDQARRRLGDVSILSEQALAKSFIEETERYARLNGPAGWGSLQPVAKKRAPIRKTDEEKARELLRRQQRRDGWE